MMIAGVTGAELAKREIAAQVCMRCVRACVSY